MIFRDLNECLKAHIFKKIYVQPTFTLVKLLILLYKIFYMKCLGIGACVDAVFLL